MCGSNELSIEIGKRIYEKRKQIGMTQERLSEIAETTPQAISNYERGERELKAKTIVKIADALNVTADYLLTGRVNALSSGHKLEDLTEKDALIINDIVEKCCELAKK